MIWKARLKEGKKKSKEEMWEESAVQNLPDEKWLIG